MMQRIKPVSPFIAANRILVLCCGPLYPNHIRYHIRCFDKPIPDLSCADMVGFRVEGLLLPKKIPMRDCCRSKPFPHEYILKKAIVGTAWKYRKSMVPELVRSELRMPKKTRTSLNELAQHQACTRRNAAYKKTFFTSRTDRR